MTNENRCVKCGYFLGKTGRTLCIKCGNQDSKAKEAVKRWMKEQKRLKRGGTG